MNTRSTSRAWWGVVVLFLVHGLVVSTWISRIPGIQASLGLNNGVLGLTLLSSALGAVAIIPSVGYLVARFGSRKMSVWCSCAFCFSVILPSLAVNAFTLALALLIYGALAAAMDVSMNAQGVEVENRLERPTMSRFHAMYSAGAMGGAALGGWLAAHELPPFPHFVASALVNVLFVLAVSRLLVADSAHLLQAEQTAHRLPLRQTPRVLLALSAIAFCVLLSEGAMADWIAVYMRQVLSAGPGTAALGFSVFSAAMAILRFLGDFITAHLGPRTTVRAGSLIAGAGVLAAICATSPWAAMPGLALAGVGMSVVIPLVFGSGGKVPGVSPGVGIATVTGIGYVGFIVGPPAIGFISQATTLRIGLGFVVLCCLIAAYLSGQIQGKAKALLLDRTIS